MSSLDAMAPCSSLPIRFSRYTLLTVPPSPPLARADISWTARRALSSSSRGRAAPTPQG
eukprot:CAMPEP_0174713072 /NCGR_PEP_ID=MMETSP1094-20130205/13867_1 /TAXON_ID=156173 /ORGANISM="Chrysochromulina brevifilum, Strain UTEX LB 985" /LENGTH=58 /DNA_ID=CAMNT_0015912219 /DNA_START=29 /DNA_END=201 /DNA_ORIENTATION=+